MGFQSGMVSSFTCGKNVPVEVLFHVENTCLKTPNFRLSSRFGCLSNISALSLKSSSASSMPGGPKTLGGLCHFLVGVAIFRLSNEGPTGQNGQSHVSERK